jgi:hypothetical protein
MGAKSTGSNSPDSWVTAATARPPVPARHERRHPPSRRLLVGEPGEVGTILLQRVSPKRERASDGTENTPVHAHNLDGNRLAPYNDPASTDRCRITDRS